MLLRLTLANIKNRFRDYIVLLTGLVISSGIFYMFANLATNKEFIKANAHFKFAAPVFIFGEILLVIITLVYVMYANSFLLSMRQHDYGLFMMLGAKRGRVGLLMVVETLTVGLIATVIGILLGIAATEGLSGLLFSQLGLNIKHLSPFYLNAIVSTFALYLILFIGASLLNLQRLIRTPVLSLLRQNDSVDRFVIHPVRLAFQGAAGIVLVGSGYAALYYIKVLQLMAIPIALVTIVLGSYLIFRSSLVLIIGWLKRTNWATKKLNGFTLSQIMFRVHDYTRILTITSLLFALALGAITVGAGFRQQINSFATAGGSYTLAVNDANATQKKQIAQLKGSDVSTYSQKIVGNNIFYNQSEFSKHPFYEYKTTDQSGMFYKQKKVPIPLKTLEKTAAQNLDFASLSGSKKKLIPKIVPAAQFNQLVGTNQSVSVITVNDISVNRAQLDKLNNSQNKHFSSAYPDMLIGTYQAYIVISGIFGGLEFIGFFLGIAFLAMLASCLVFKILSGTNQDKIRYNLLNKIGTQKKLLKQSINREILVLFAAPGILGIIDVLFGLQMFKSLMDHPYANIQYPIIIFVIIYMLYYWFTIWMYKLIVLPKKSR
ncbi:FtsX-like permease family protein [Pediococcus claussenii]|uniref:ABC transporter, permease component n=1 Tax=Pediococcus claussenii (strain ATCC BAA-344 / DSM 14800 / JCM 18046 / KCTC 3811 / LMG 21948 / P06) TaxID=701521 RepID=G8PBF6_PEDCP|nr:FtsX-like permease family protein [Pediococcus claussenii]AEV95945.1 ABC transporter, permease component [Pediococcus claussenii ATCC BAA-344]ANZ69435.1 peptide ABC transporter permease [Pediococcus claussenii]ANZ71255.1 peptide ABC transporter permease [Pediococcus claussenii]KRN20552.1 hypothetical protein IV79_GL000610 [Pediococcus claussenii]